VCVCVCVGGWREGRIKAAGAECQEIWQPQTPGTLRVCTEIALPYQIVKSSAC